MNVSNSIAPIAAGGLALPPPISWIIIEAAIQCTNITLLAALAIAILSGITMLLTHGGYQSKKILRYSSITLITLLMVRVALGFTLHYYMW